MRQNARKLKNGDEVLYLNRTHDAVPLVFVETTKNGLNRFFSAQFPTMEYHLANDCPQISEFQEPFKEEIEEQYVAFSGPNSNKRKAYEALLARRGQEFNP